MGQSRASSCARGLPRDAPMGKPPFGLKARPSGSRWPHSLNSRTICARHLPLRRRLRQAELLSSRLRWFLARDYSLDIGSCITRSWELVKQHLGPMVGITFLVMVVIGVINQLVGLLSRPAIMGMITEHRVSIGGIAIIFVDFFPHHAGLCRPHRGLVQILLEAHPQGTGGDRGRLLRVRPGSGTIGLARAGERLPEPDRLLPVYSARNLSDRILDVRRSPGH